MNEVIGIIIAAILCWLNFVIVDTYFGLPEQPGVRGARIVGEDVKKRGGDIAGGFFQGNILCSPDASAGTLMASIGYLLLGIPGGIIATVGSLTATIIVFICSFVGLTPEMFIVGMVIAILTIQGIDQVRASIFLGKIAQKFNRHAEEWLYVCWNYWNYSHICSIKSIDNTK